MSDAPPGNWMRNATSQMVDGCCQCLWYVVLTWCNKSKELWSIIEFMNFSIALSNEKFRTSQQNHNLWLIRNCKWIALIALHSKNKLTIKSLDMFLILNWPCYMHCFTSLKPIKSTHSSRSTFWFTVIILVTSIKYKTIILHFVN